MRTGVVVDTACDLPQSYIEKHDIHILPVSLKFGDESYLDTRDPAETQKFFKKYLSDKKVTVSTEPLSAEAIQTMFLEELVIKYDRVLVITVSNSFSKIYENATKASFTILNNYQERRKNAGIDGKFYLNVLNSKTAFTGQAIIVHEAIRLLHEEKLSFSRLRPMVAALSDHIYTYTIPNDLYYIRKRDSRTGEKRLSGFRYMVAKLLDIKPIVRIHRGETDPIENTRSFDNAVQKLFSRAERAIEGGLMTKLIAMSYAGDPTDITRTDPFKNFEKFCLVHGIKTMISVMSTTGGINIGPGTFSLAYAPIGDEP